jgi:hypothetical protein
MKTSVLAAAMLAAFAMPAFADDASKADDGQTKMMVDPATTASTNQSQMKTTVSKQGYSGCMKRHTAAMM